MILYYFDKNNGQIAYGDTDESQIKDLMWDLNDNRLSSINDIFYVKVNVELYSKYFVKYFQKMYNYPGLYYLKCFYKDEPSKITSRKVTVNDSKN